MRLGLAAVLVLGACRDAPVVVVAADAQPPPPVDAGAVDAPPPACGSTATRELTISTVHLTAPPGCCFHRLREGDDLSGDIIDESGRARIHYTAFAHDRIGDACGAGRGMRIAGTGRIGAASYRSCATASDVGPRRVCASVDDKRGTIVNLCADEPEAGYAPIDVVRPSSH